MKGILNLAPAPPSVERTALRVSFNLLISTFKSSGCDFLDFSNRWFYLSNNINKLNSENTSSFGIFRLVRRVITSILAYVQRRYMCRSCYDQGKAADIVYKRGQQPEEHTPTTGIYILEVSSKRKPGNTWR